MTPTPLRFSLGKLVRLFLAVFLLYGILYKAADYGRGRMGPWILTFDEAPSGSPRVTINHDKLQIRGVQIVADGDAAVPDGRGPATVRFRSPADEPSFGKVLFTDLTFLPGVITLDFFGHEVEILPRVLVINRKSFAWSQAKEFRLLPEERLPGGPLSPQKRKQLGREFP